MIAVTYFPKLCHLHKFHKAPMAYVEGKPDQPMPGTAGWVCDRCYLKCRAHKVPMRSGLGIYGDTYTLYCRLCRLQEIETVARPRRQATIKALQTQWHIMGDPGRDPGVAWINGVRQ